MSERASRRAAKRGGPASLRAGCQQPPRKAPEDAKRRQPASALRPDGLDLLASHQPSVEASVMAADLISALLAILDPMAAAVAGLRLKGYGVSAIGAELDVANRTVKWRLRAIRAIWANSCLLDQPNMKIFTK